MENNTNNYSDEWQPYTGDYDKFEYDIKLHDGTIVENCYPNARKFNSISDEHNGLDFDESQVAEIRFSERPRFGINEQVSSHPQFKWLEEQSEKRSSREQNSVDAFIGAAYQFAQLEDLPNMYVFDNPKHRIGTKGQSSKRRGKIVQVRTEPKIGRNEPCTCGSGNKYKNCCLNN